jgi:hypothetical protein
MPLASAAAYRFAKCVAGGQFHRSSIENHLSVWKIMEMKKFNGTLYRLQRAVAECKIAGEWSERPENAARYFRARTGEILAWWPTTGTLVFQGKNPETFRHRLTKVLKAPPTPVKAASRPATGAKFMVACGYDLETSKRLAALLRKLGLKPRVLGC